MRNVVWLILGCIIYICIGACSGKSDQTAQTRKTGPADAAVNKELVQKFLTGVQTGDKNLMYEAANLTPEIVNDSREKLIHPTQDKKSDQQRRDLEHALRTSGNIDFFIAKIRKMMPKSARFQIKQTATKSLTEGVKITDYSIKITYENKAEAMSDKTGKPVKEMVIRFVQVSRPLNGRLIHDFSFDSNYFEKMADRNFEVVSYY